jgi:hypothetical protein
MSQQDLEEVRRGYELFVETARFEGDIATDDLEALRAVGLAV